MKSVRWLGGAAEDQCSQLWSGLFFAVSLSGLVYGRWIRSIGAVSVLIADWKACWSDFAGRWRQSARKGFLWMVGCVVLTWLIFGWFDESLLLWIQGRSGADLNVKRVITEDQQGWVRFCKQLHYYTKFEWLNLLGAAALIVVGLARKSCRLRQSGLALLLAGGMAGLAVQAVKTTNGRPRPSTLAKSEEAQSAYDFRGVTFKGGWRGYPSGHSASVWGSCVALGLRFRKLLWPLMLFSALVTWSRVYGSYHWPTDALHGSALGALFGWFWGGSVKGKGEEV